MKHFNVMNDFGYTFPIKKSDDMYNRNYIATDEYNQLIYKCVYTGYVGVESEFNFVGSVMPYVNVRSPVKKDMMHLHKENVKAFQTSEMNCNTCKNLQRVKHEKCSNGFLYGKCNVDKDTDNLVHGLVEGVIKFHPNDPMHMKCYEAR